MNYPGLKGATLEITVKTPQDSKTQTERIDVEKPELWMTENPKLYTYTVRRGQDAV